MARQNTTAGACRVDNSGCRSTTRVHKRAASLRCNSKRRRRRKRPCKRQAAAVVVDGGSGSTAAAAAEPPPERGAIQSQWLNEFTRQPAHAVPNWQAPASTGKPAGHRGVARWRVTGANDVANALIRRWRHPRQQDLGVAVTWFRAATAAAEINFSYTLHLRLPDGRPICTADSLLGFGAGGRLPILHGVGGFMFNSSSSCICLGE